MKPSRPPRAPRIPSPRALWETEMETAAQVQTRLLAGPVPKCDCYAAAATCIPAGIIGGDYYDFLPRADHRLRVVVADVVGKGVGAALVLVMVRTAVRTLSPGYDRPADLLTGLNRLLVADLQTLDAYVTLACADFDFHARRLAVACAGHPSPLQVRHQAGVEQLRIRGAMLGVAADSAYTQVETSLLPQDLVVLYTDGVTEARNAHGQLLTVSGLTQILESSTASTPVQVQSDVIARVHSFAGANPLRDDLTLALVQVLLPGPCGAGPSSGTTLVASPRGIAICSDAGSFG